MARNSAILGKGLLCWATLGVLRRGEDGLGPAMAWPLGDIFTVSPKENYKEGETGLTQIQTIFKFKI